MVHDTPFFSLGCILFAVCLIQKHYHLFLTSIVCCLLPFNMGQQAPWALAATRFGHPKNIYIENEISHDINLNMWNNLDNTRAFLSSFLSRACLIVKPE
jgi:hypothetical protein